jgi:cadmium resistance protein CadD (predicted permease)
MDMRKTWDKWVMAALYLVTGIFFLINFIDLIGIPAMPFGTVCASIVPWVFFFGTAAWLISKAMGMDSARYIILAVGIINTILMLIAIFSDLNGAFGMTAAVANTLLYLTVFALLPLVMGIKKLMNRDAEAK